MFSSEGKIIISVAKGVGLWGRAKSKSLDEPGQEGKEGEKEEMLYNSVKVVESLFEEMSPSYFKQVSESKEVTKANAILTSSLSGLKLELAQFQQVWEKYTDIWNLDREEYKDQLLRSKPKLVDFEDDLHRFTMIMSQLSSEKDEFQLGRILVSTTAFKKILKSEIQQWINMLASTLYSKYKREMSYLINQIEDMDKKLDRPINDLDDIRIIMETQKKIREIEIDMEFKIKTVEGAFTLIGKYNLPVTTEDKDLVENLAGSWLALQAKSMEVQILLSAVQEHFQRELKNNLDIFQVDCDNYCKNYHANGPMQPGLSPKEASDKLAIFQNQFDALWRKHHSYSVGEGKGDYLLSSFYYSQTSLGWSTPTRRG